MSLLIKNAFVCIDNEIHKKDIYIKNGIIEKIDDKIELKMTEILDVEENYIFPGLIDMYCNICDPGYEYKEDIMSVSNAAAKGGYTSITCQPTTKPVIDEKTAVDYIINKSKKLSKVNIFPYGSMTKGCEGIEMAEIGEMIKAGIVAVSDGGMSVQDSHLMKNILYYSSMFQIPVITICEDKRLSENGVMNSGKMSTQIGLSGIAREAEEVVLSRNLVLAKYNESKLHITHVSTKGSVEYIRYAKSKGVNVTCETCPHYFTLSEEIVESYNTLGKIRPPLRTKEDIESIKEGLVDGTIDVISSGHTPATIESKNTEFDRASFGISSIETAFYVSYNALVKENILSLSQLIDKMSTSPSKILGLKNKGEIKVGADADLTIFNKNGKFVVNSNEFVSKAKFSPYNNTNFGGEIIYTIVNGKIVYNK